MMEYGRTLDNRDFAGFAALFSRDAEYGGARGPLQKGPAAIRALLEMQLGRNAAPQPGRDYHFFYNETIDVNGDTATALSKGAFYTTSEARKLETGSAVNYHDEFIREDGKWKFKKRVLGERPANCRGATPASTPPAALPRPRRPIGRCASSSARRLPPYGPVARSVFHANATGSISCTSSEIAIGTLSETP